MNECETFLLTSINTYKSFSDWLCDDIYSFKASL